MPIKRINEFPDGSGSLTADDLFLFMDDPSGEAVTKKVSLSALSAAIGSDSETLTSISINANVLTYTDENGNSTNIDLSLYLDDTNLARLVNGSLDPITGIGTFTRDDGTTFTVDFSSLLPQAESNDLTANVTWANVPDANITESSVVQHSGALRLTESQIVDLGSYLTDVVDDTMPQLGGDLDLNNNNIIGTGNITANSGNFDQINFNTSLGEPDVSAGQFAWHENEGTLALGVSDSYAMFVGEELHYRVRNNTESTIRAGTPVYASGLTSGGNNRIAVAPYVADGNIRELRFMGLTTEDFGSGLNGYTTHFGYIRNIDTRGDASSNGYTNKLWADGEPAWAEGDILYVHPTTAGKLTKIEPKHSINVAIILNRHENNGKIFVRPTSYGHLNDNHDVNISGISNRDVLVYNTGTEYWENNNSVIFQEDNIGLLDGNVMYDYTLSGGTVGTLNPSSSTVKVNIVRINPSAELIIQGIIPPSNGSAKIYDKFTLINISDNTVKLKHNSGTTINRIWLDSSLSDGAETVLRKGESAELYYVNGVFDSVSSSRWLCHLNQNELNGYVVAGTGILLTYNSGNNELEISTSLYSAPVGISGASAVNNIVQISQADYDNLGSYEPNTIYFIV